MCVCMRSLVCARACARAHVCTCAVISHVCVRQGCSLYVGVLFGVKGSDLLVFASADKTPRELQRSKIRETGAVPANRHSYLGL